MFLAQQAMSVVVFIAMAIVVLAAQIRSVNAVPYDVVGYVVGVGTFMLVFSAVALRLANRFLLAQVSHPHRVYRDSTGSCCWTVDASTDTTTCHQSIVPVP